MIFEVDEQLVNRFVQAASASLRHTNPANGLCAAIALTTHVYEKLTQFAEDMGEPGMFASTQETMLAFGVLLQEMARATMAADVAAIYARAATHSKAAYHAVRANPTQTQ